MYDKIHYKLKKKNTSKEKKKKINENHKELLPLLVISSDIYNNRNKN